jgi:hypothetical protein
MPPVPSTSSASAPPLLRRQVRGKDQVGELLAKVRAALAEEAEFIHAHLGLGASREERKANYAQDDRAYLAGVEEVLAYAARQAELFAGRADPDEVTSKRLDVIESRTSRQMDNRARDSYFPAEGRRYAVQWLRGESTTPPADPGGYGPYCRGRSSRPCSARSGTAKRQAAQTAASCPGAAERCRHNAPRCPIAGVGAEKIKGPFISESQ